MNYQHLHHAGNFADVLKHSLVTLLLEYLQKKPAGYCYIDTHAGSGSYDLMLQKTQEATQGIQRLLSYSAPPLPELNTYLSCLNPADRNWYPGSPMIAQQLQRPQDRLILNEAHPEVFQHLKMHFGKIATIALHKRDAYEFLPAIVPPIEKRGLVLIDPPFETPTELKDINTALCKSVQRWPQGIYMIWTPITHKTPAQALSILLRNITLEALIIDFSIADPIENVSGLIGSQIVILNSPWQFDATTTRVAEYLWKVLNNGGNWKVRTVKP